MVDQPFVLKHLVRQPDEGRGGQWKGRAIFCCSTDSPSGRATMLVERTEIDPVTQCCKPPYYETVFIDETSETDFTRPN